MSEPPSKSPSRRYLARRGESRVAKDVLLSAAPPIMLKTAENPGGLPKEVFDGLQAQVANNRAQFYRDLPTGPFYGYNRPGAKVSEGLIQNWWRQGMIGGVKAGICWLAGKCAVKRCTVPIAKKIEER